MKRMTMLTMVALALGSASCVPDTQSVQIKYAMAGAISGGCEVSKSDAQLFGGGVDVDWTDTYWLALRVGSNLEAEDWRAGESTVHSKSRNDFYIESAIVRYSGLDIESTQAGAGTVEAGGELYLGVNALSPAAAAKLQPGKTVTVEVTLKGKFAHGGEYETAPFYFPISVVSSGTTRPMCAAGETPTSLGDGEGSPPCGNWGQDGYYFYCKSGT